MLMKKHFMDYYNRVSHKKKLPKVLFKFGANHMTRGINYTKVYDIGNFVSELANANGSKSFNLLVIPTSGTQNRWVPFIPDESLKRKAIKGTDSSFGDISALVALSDGGKWKLVDLAPLRNPIHYRKVKNLPKGFLNLVYGFDAVLLLPNATASTNFE